MTNHEASPTPNPIDQLPAGFENAFDPAARHDATAEAVSWNQYFSILDRPVQTEPMSLKIDGDSITPGGDPNPHYLHKSIARTETPGTAATETGVDTDYIRSLDTPAGPIRMSELPRGIRVNETANKTISQIRESLAATREDIATAGSDHTETVTRVKKDGTFKQKETTIGADKTAELVLQEQLSEQLDGLAVKLARSGMSDDRILETIIALNEGTPAYRRKIGETRKGKAKYETVPAKEGLSLTEEEITRVLNGITFVQASDEAKAVKEVKEEVKEDPIWKPLAPAAKPVAPAVAGPSRAAPSRRAPAPAAPVRTAPRPTPVVEKTPVVTEEERKAKFEEQVAAVDQEIRAAYEKAYEADNTVTPVRFLMSTFEDKIKAHLLGGKDTGDFRDKPSGVAIRRLLANTAKEMGSNEDEVERIRTRMGDEMRDITKRVRAELAPKRGAKLKGILRIGGQRKPKSPKVRITS